jgi:hypothetical protein
LLNALFVPKPLAVQISAKPRIVPLSGFSSALWQPENAKNTGRNGRTIKVHHHNCTDLVQKNQRTNSGPNFRSNLCSPASMDG